MKKFTCLLLSFIVLLSCFVVPVNAESVDVSSGDYFIRRKICSLDATTNEYKEVAATTIFSDNLNSTWSYQISNSYLLNPTRKYFNYYSVAKTDNSLLCKNGNDLTIEMFMFCDYLARDETSYKFNVDNVNVECGYINAQGQMRVLDRSCVELRKSTTEGFYDIIIRVPYQDEDIYSVYCRLYYVLNQGFDAPSTFFGENAVYMMVNGSLNIDIEKGDKTSGLLNSILEWLNGIWNAIIRIPEAIGEKLTELKNAITNTINNIENWLTDLGNTILDGLKTLFIPSDNYFQVKFNNLHDTLVNKLGVLALPFTLIKGLLELFVTIGNGDGIIEFPHWDIFGVNLFEGGSLNVKELINNCRNTISSFTDIDFVGLYYTFVDAILWIGFINLCRKKFSNITLGGSE